MQAERMAKRFNKAEVRRSPTALEKDEMGWVSSHKGSFSDTAFLPVIGATDFPEQST